MESDTASNETLTLLNELHAAVEKIKAKDPAGKDELESAEARLVSLIHTLETDSKSEMGKMHEILQHLTDDIRSIGADVLGLKRTTPKTSPTVEKNKGSSGLTLMDF